MGRGLPVAHRPRIMNRFLKDKEHLFRMAALFAAGVVLFLILRAVLVPKGFGVYGHYRAGALADNRVRTPRFAGRATCIECHTDERDALKGGKHAGDPSASKAVKPDAKMICFTCHLANVAKPKKFPQMDPKNHFDGGACIGCHSPHAPDKEPKK